MQKLQKILEEIEEATRQEDAPIYCGNMEVDGYVRKSVVEEIIRNHTNDGWISVEKFGLPKSNEHDFMFWITIQYVNGFRRTIKAKWDWFDKCFMHQNGKKISEDVVAYKYYSAPEPYRPERSEEE